jgi:alkaline phosphatase D
MKFNPVLSVGALALALVAPSTVFAAHLGNGIKIGETTATSAIVWTRLTAEPERNRTGERFASDDDRVPVGRTLADMRDSLMAAAAGEARVHFWVEGLEHQKRDTPWTPLRADRDGTVQFELFDLLPRRHYHVKVEARPGPDQAVSATVDGRFWTAPAIDQSGNISFTVVTCHDFIRRDDLENGHRIYPAMAALQPHFTVHAGDVVYYDKPNPYAKNAELARYKWNRLFALPFQRDYYANHAVYFQKDDHDVVANDAWPGAVFGDLTWEQGLGIFREQTPTGFRPYRTVRWGEHLQIWLMEGREFRSPNDMPDGPDKSIWGEEQRAWFFETFARSTATFRVLVSSMPVLGPDRPRKNDNHANEGFANEGREIRDFLASQENAFVVNGDRHWQYATIDPTRGIREYGCGPGSDSHAGGWSMKRQKPQQKFLRIAGGFLRVSTGMEAGQPTARIQHYSVDGEMVNEDILTALPRPIWKSPESISSDAWEVLFDGDQEQLAQFHLYNEPQVQPERWSVIGDVLTLASRAEAPHLRNKEDIVISPRGLRDFELELDWKMSVGGNGGIFYKVVEGPQHSKPWHTGLEYQLLDNENHANGAVDRQRAASLFDLFAPVEAVTRPALAWNHTRIVVRGTQVEHWLNGDRVLVADTSSPEWVEAVAQSKYRELKNFAQPVAGQIILQDHGDRAWYKNIRIREL